MTNAVVVEGTLLFGDTTAPLDRRAPLKAALSGRFGPLGGRSVVNLGTSPPDVGKNQPREHVPGNLF